MKFANIVCSRTGLFTAPVPRHDPRRLRGCHQRQRQYPPLGCFPLLGSHHRVPRFPAHRPRTHQRPAAALCASCVAEGQLPDLCFRRSRGSTQAYRLDLKNGQARLLTDAENFDPACFTLLADERSFCYVDGGRLYSSSLTSLRPRQVYQAPEGYRPTGMSITDDGLSAALVEKGREGSHYRLQLIRMMDGMATTLAEADQENDELSDPMPRPRRASVLYRRAGGVWLANLDGKQNYRLKLADGQAAAATWSPDGRTCSVPQRSGRSAQAAQHPRVHAGHERG